MPILTACGKDNVYELGPYSITKDEYAYLMSDYKRKIMESLGLDETYLDYQVNESGVTYNQFIETAYRQEFEQSVYTLLYAQALFDEYDLKLTSEEKKAVKNSANIIITNVAGGRKSAFNNLVKDYGYDSDTLYSVYEKRAKESKVVNYLYGDNFSNITDVQRESYYQNNYVHFQAIIVNTLYYKNSSGAYINYSEDEKKTREALRDELTEFLCHKNYTYNYTVLPMYIGKAVVTTNANGDLVPNVTYDELWANTEINDDTLYPDGYYMVKPNQLQSLNKSPLTQAMLTPVGETTLITAKRTFTGSGTITDVSGSTEVKDGDYFEYGTAYINRRELNAGAWRNSENKDFFGDDFTTRTAQYSIFQTLNAYASSSPYTLMAKDELIAKYSLSTIYPNYVDYEYFHPTSEE